MEEQTSPSPYRPTLSNPEGVLMLGFALVADIVTPFIVLPLDLFFGVGEIVAWIFDVFFTLTLGTWMFVRGGGGGQFGRKKIMQFLKKRATWIAIEYIPLIGSLVPAWTINTILFLREKE